MPAQQRRLGVVNGTRATITSAQPDQRTLTITTDDGRQVLIPPDYLDAGHVTHGYAITGHKAQGLTVDHAFVLGSAELYREWGYVALSRGRLANRMYVHPAALDLDLDRHAPAPDGDAIASLTARLGCSRAHAAVSDPAPALAARWRQLYRQLADPAVTRQRALAYQHDTLVERHDTLARLVAQDERQLSELGRGLARLRNRPRRGEVEDRLRRNREQLIKTQEQLRQTARQLSRLAASATIAATREECVGLARQIAKTARARVHEFEHDPPGYLMSSLGTPSQDPWALASWRDAAHTVEAYRLRWAISDPHRPLGEPPDDPLQVSDYRRAVDAIGRTQRDLRSPERGHSRAIGLGR